MSQLFAILGAIAMILAAMGIYGVTSFAVAQRTAEIGIRRALGARARHVGAVVGHSGVRGLLLGLGVGIPAALLAGKGAAVAFGLYQVRKADPVVLAVVTALLIGVTVVAMLVPTHRALRVDPMVSLRRE